MDYSTQMNGQYQPVGQPSQTVHAATPPAYDTMRNQQPGTANISCQFWTADPRIQPQQNGHVPFQDGTQPSSQMANWQTSAAPRQASSSQSTAGRNDKHYVLYQKYPNLTGILGEVTSMPYQNAAQNSKTQTLPTMNTEHSQQNTTAYLIRSATFHGNQSIRTQDVQNNGVQKSYQVVNGKLSNPCSTYINAATLAPCKQTVCASTIQLTRPPANNQDYQQNVSQHRFTTSNPPNYSEAISESCTRNSITTNPPPRGQIWGYSSMSPTTQQYTAQLNSTPNNAREATYRPPCSSIKRNGLPLIAQQQIPNQKEEAKIISQIAESLRESYQADKVGRHPVKTNSPSTWRLIAPASQVCEVRMMERHQTMQLGTSAADRSNSFATQRLQLIAKQSVLSRTQPIVTSPQQSSAPDVYRVTTEDGFTAGNRERSAFFPKNDSISTVNVVESSSDGSQFMQLPEGILLQRAETKLTVENNNEMLCSVGKMDSSIQSSPSRMCKRAVAVVQPLLQENYTALNKQNSSNPIKQLEECTAKYSSLRNPLEISTSPSVAKNSQAIHLSEGLNKHLQDGPQDKIQNQSYAHEQGSELSSDRRIPIAVQQSVTPEGLEGPHRDLNKAQVPLNKNTCDFDLSSIPTTQWTTDKLMHFITDSEKAQTIRSKKLYSVQEIIRIFWMGKVDIFKNKLKSGWYKNLMTDVTTFCCEHVTNDSVILSQIKGSFSKQLQKYHFLKHNEMYSEPPYQSSWLNINEQVDDIDKEFGFSRNLRPHVSSRGSDSQLDEFEATSSIFADNLSDVSNDALSQTELRSVVQVEEAPTVENTSSRISSPNDIDPDSANSNDQHYSFEIQVLSPEEAKVIFGKMQSNLPQSMDTPSQPENVTKSSVEKELPDFGQSVTKSSMENELTEVGDTLKDSKLESKKKVSLIDEFCCLAGWIEKFYGKNTSSKCACKEKQDHKDCTEKTLDKETKVQNSNQLAIRLDHVHSAIETDHQLSAEENSDSQVVPCSSTDDISQTVDLTEDEKRLRSHSAQEKQNMSPSTIDDSQLSPLVLSDSEVEDVSCSGSEIPNQIRQNGIWMSDSEEKCVQEQPKSEGIGQSSPSDKSKGEFMKVINLVSHMSDTAVSCPKAQLTSTDVAGSSLEVEKPTQTGPADGLHNTSSQCDKLETVERKRKLHSDEDMSQLLKNLKKRVNRNVSGNAAESKPLASNDKTVQLVLYGSKRTLFGDRKSDGEYTGSHASHRPPNMVSVTLNPLKRKSSVPTPEYSVKGRILEKWRRSYLPTTLKLRKKLKTHHGTLPRTYLKKAETACPSKTKELPVCNEMKRKGKTDYSVNRKKRRLVCTRLVLGDESRRNDVGDLLPSDKERSDDGSHTHTPGRENYILKFSVLPNTFRFADGPNGRKQTTADVSGNSAGGNSPAFPRPPASSKNFNSKTFRRSSHSK
ncbi:uncharacterized protein si:ch211-106e7.2 [Platichthys flesus]|uniref:uncharacterized protein si:ch211-106e7.2 n=1 Tax=Platichthys flesus TaxID=8260 RepID=UPI002DBFC4E9|nr:uncharacterized protein si:ch211-106e7.2 [Platichthys flesus]